MAIENNANDLTIVGTTIPINAGVYIRQEIAIFANGLSVKMVNIAYQNRQSYIDGDPPINIDGVPASFDIDILSLSPEAQQALNDSLYYTQQEVINKLEILNPTWSGVLNLIDVNIP